MTTIILKGGAELSATSINGLCQAVAEHIGVKSPAGMNRTSAVKWLKRNGAEALTIKGEAIDLEDFKASETRNPQATLIERLVKATTTINTAKIKELEAELVKSVSNAKTLDDLQKVQQINNEIAELKNPRADLKTILEYVKKIFNEYQEAQTE